MSLRQTLFYSFEINNKISLLDRDTEYILIFYFSIYIPRGKIHDRYLKYIGEKYYCIVAIQYTEVLTSAGA